MGSRSTIGLNADTVGSCLDSPEGPARTTVRLIADLPNGGALRPLGTGIEGSGEGGNIKVGMDLAGKGNRVGGLLNTTETLGSLEGRTGKTLINARRPSNISIVYGLYDISTNGIIRMTTMMLTCRYKRDTSHEGNSENSELHGEKVEYGGAI
jgi:hypothetical protein